MKRTFLLFILPFIVCTYLAFVLSQMACDYIMSNHPDKKIQFNHKSHLTKYGTDCNTCHSYYENGRYKGIPVVGMCTQSGCHERSAETQGTDPLQAKRKPQLDKFKDTDSPWGSFAAQPDLVYFSHMVVMSAQKDGKPRARCGSCHGNKADSTTTKKLKGKMLMGQCEDCHTALKISNACTVCHD